MEFHNENGTATKNGAATEVKSNAVQTAVAKANAAQKAANRNSKNEANYLSLTCNLKTQLGMPMRRRTVTWPSGCRWKYGNQEEEVMHSGAGLAEDQPDVELARGIHLSPDTIDQSFDN
ncbi:hypothetical protein HDF18_13690 [Mucilaginibacter sp. X5P1]|uniref:hypothetical protein n=1 Tax=Mucilaginibacter sp. X5P1 TaxID=2723088 RepID=UPI00161774A5|nr:hypothetical protein [Mucilaginibacter sp. X5P1]MBB6141932.1 hypothetical protein [Mucilaginibacter sp. X5P1]